MQDELRRLYPDAECALDYANPWQLLVATILSAQSTDERVNLVTPSLFRRFPGPVEMSEATQEEVETEIQSIGLFRNKAKNLRGAASRLVELHGGAVPQSLEALVALPGVARKTANVVRGVAWGLADGVVVDTHVARLSWRMGFSSERHNVVKIERDLMWLIPHDDWVMISHRLIFHGRRVCAARSPRCDVCQLFTWCHSAGRLESRERRLEQARARKGGNG